LSSLDIHEILKLLPHRYPFLLVDRVSDYTPGESLHAIKNVSMNEPFFPGHFPRRPVMPGVLILEALAQATALLAFVSDESTNNGHTLYYFLGIDKARFKRSVEPGDQMHLHVSVKRIMRGVWMFDSEARVDDQVVCTAEIMCTAKDIDA